MDARVQVPERSAVDAVVVQLDTPTKAVLYIGHSAGQAAALSEADHLHHRYADDRKHTKWRKTG